jgi:hypothetical protein
VTRVNYKVDRDYVSRQTDWAKDAAVRHAQEFNNDVLDILIQSGVLVIDINGPYQVNTGNFFGRFKVAQPVVDLPKEER